MQQQTSIIKSTNYIISFPSFGVLFLFYIHCGYQILAKQLSAVHGCALSTINSGCFRMHTSLLIGPNYTICGLDYKEKVNVQTMGAVGEPKKKIR